MKITRLPYETKIDDDAMVSLIYMGNIKNIKFVEKANRKQTILKISKDEYMRMDSGEILQIKHSDSRADDKVSLYKTFRHIREIINTNCSNPRNIRWITLTYAENMTDTKRLYRDFHSFNQRFQRRHGKAEYITIAEPQKRGAWHMHLMYIWDSEAPFIPNKELNSLWGHGFVNVQRVNDVDNLGAYLSAYLGNVPLEEAIENNLLDDRLNVIETEVNGQVKKFVKGARLKLYPAGMKIYRCSRGIRKPDVVRMKYKDALKEVEGCSKTYQCAYIIENEEANFRSSAISEWYNSER